MSKCYTSLLYLLGMIFAIVLTMAFVKPMAYSAGVRADEEQGAFTPTTLALVDGAYQIKKLDDLRSVAYYVNNEIDDYASASYRLNAIIDMRGVNWTPIGTIDKPFAGTFDGNGYTLYGLTIVNDNNANDEYDNETCYGLFGAISNTAQITKLGLMDTKIVTNGKYVGSLVGLIDDGDGSNRAVIDQCYNTGYIEGGYFVGGLIGYVGALTKVTNVYNKSGSINLSRFDDVSTSGYDVFAKCEQSNATGGAVGGLVGRLANTNITINYAYSASVVGAGARMDNNTIGAIIGSYDSTFSRTVYLVIMGDCLGKDEDGKDRGQKLYCSYTATCGQKSIPYINRYFVTQDTGYWVSDSTKNWFYTSIDDYNDYLPVLYNVRPLELIALQAMTMDGTVLADDTYDISLLETSDKEVYPLGDNQYLVPIGSTPTLSVELKGDGQRLYQFANKWVGANMAKNFYGEYEPATDVLTYANTMVRIVGDRTYTAYFEAKEYTFTLLTQTLSEGENLTAEITLNGEKTNSIIVNYDDEIAVQIVSPVGYKQVTDINTLSVKELVDNNIVDGVIPTNLTSTVYFVYKTYQINFEAGAYDASSGYIISSDFSANATIADTSAVIYQQVINLEYQNNNANYVFKHWLIKYSDGTVSVYDENSQAVSYVVEDLTDGDAITFVAVFDKKCVDINIIYDDLKGAVLLDGVAQNVTTIYYDAGYTFSVASNTGYLIASVKINGEEQLTDAISSFDKNVTVGTELDADVEIIILFKNNNFNVIFDISYVDNKKYDLVEDENALKIFNGADEYQLNTTYSVEYQSALNIVLADIDDAYSLNKVIMNNEEQKINSFTVMGDMHFVIVLQLKKVKVTAELAYLENSVYSMDISYVTGLGEYDYGSAVQTQISLPVMFALASVKYNQDEAITQNLPYVWSSEHLTTDMHITYGLNVARSAITLQAIGDEENTEPFIIVCDGETYTFGTNSVLVIDNIKYGSVVDLAISGVYYDQGARAGQKAFQYWTREGNPVSSARYLSIEMGMDDVSICAVFGLANLDVVVNSKLRDVNGEYTITRVAGYTTGINTTSYLYGANITLKAQSAKGYRFVGWLNNETNEIESTESTITLVVSKPLDYSAIYEDIASVAVISNIKDAGTMTGAGIYVVGDSVTITAEAKEGYKFVGWQQDEDEEIITEKSYTFIMTNADVLFKAIYQVYYTVNCVLNDASLGQVVGNTVGTNNDQIVLTALNNSNSTFIGWAVDGVIISTDRTLSLTLNGSVNLKAMFKKNFDWNIVIVLAGGMLLLVVLISSVSTYIRTREEEPVKVRALLEGKDDSALLRNPARKDKVRDQIAPVPTRKVAKVNIQPIPVRKVSVAPCNHKGEMVSKKSNARDQKPTLRTDE